jgi:hypothetical protein
MLAFRQRAPTIGLPQVQRQRGQSPCDGWRSSLLGIGVMLTVALPLVRGTGDSALASAPHYTLGLYPFSIPPYQTSTVELITTADSPALRSTTSTSISEQMYGTSIAPPRVSACITRILPATKPSNS